MTVWDHLNGKLQGPPRERIIMPEEVARWRELRRRGWTYGRIAAGSEWTEIAVYTRLNGRFAPLRSRFVRPAPPPRTDGPRRVTPEEVARWREQRAADWKYRRIAEADGRNPSTVWAHVTGKLKGRRYAT